MLEFAAMMVVSAVALTFVTDTTSGAMKMVRAVRRRDKIRVAQSH